MIAIDRPSSLPDFDAVAEIADAVWSFLGFLLTKPVSSFFLFEPAFNAEEVSVDRVLSVLATVDYK
jgi:hypothetical protein